MKNQHSASPRGRVLIIAGTDPSGGAGIHADIKTVTALGGYATTAISALVSQNTMGLYGGKAAIQPISPDYVQLQMRAVLEDIGADCIKTGMLADAEMIDAVCDILEEPAYRDIPLVVDPVMVAKSGDVLLAPESISTLKRRLLLIADVLTPNLPEAYQLTGMEIRDVDDMYHAATMLRTLGPDAVLMKGGHLEGEEVMDMLMISDDEAAVFSDPRIHSRNTHGTGCTLASAVATGIAQGLELTDAVARARIYVRKAIEQAPGFGQGAGPLWHGHTVTPFEVTHESF